MKGRRVSVTVAEVDPFGIDGGPAMLNQEGAGGFPSALPMANPATLSPVQATASDLESKLPSSANDMNSIEAGVTVTDGAGGAGGGVVVGAGCVAPPPPPPPPQPAS